MFLRIFPFILVLLGVMVDVSIVPVLVEDAAMPIISLCIVVALAMTLGRTYGTLFGLFAGLLIDVTVGNPVGLMIVVYILAGYLGGFVAGGRKRNWLLHLVMPVLLIALYEVAITGYRYVVSGVLGLGEALPNVVRITAGIVIIQLLYLVFAAIFKPRRSTYA